MTDDNLLLDGLNESEIRQMAIALRKMRRNIKRFSAIELLNRALADHDRVIRESCDRQDEEAARMPQHEDNAPAAL